MNMFAFVQKCICRALIDYWGALSCFAVLSIDLGFHFNPPSQFFCFLGVAEGVISARYPL